MLRLLGVGSVDEDTTSSPIELTRIPQIIPPSEDEGSGITGVTLVYQYINTKVNLPEPTRNKQVPPAIRALLQHYPGENNSEKWLVALKREVENVVETRPIRGEEKDGASETTPEERNEDSSDLESQDTFFKDPIMANW